MLSALVAALVTGMLLGPVAAKADTPGPLPFAPHGLSQARFAAATAGQYVFVPGADGVPIATIVFRPDTSSDPAWKTPVLLLDSPYFENRIYDVGVGDVTDDAATLANWDLVTRYTPRGYTVVVAEMRGTGRSGGCWDHWGPEDAQDFKDVVEHFAAQPWSNGKEGSWGGSAEGMTQENGATLDPKGLVTVVPIQAASGVYDTAAFDGVPYDGGPLLSGSYHLYSFGNTDSPAATPQEIAANQAARGCEATQWATTLTPVADGTMSPWYRDREWRTRVRGVRASVLYYATFHDLNVLPIAVDGWYDQLAGFKRAVFGQGVHQAPWAADPAIRRNDWWGMFDAWFDHWLLDLPTGVESWPNVQVQDEHNVWRGVGSFAALGTSSNYPLGPSELGSVSQPGAARSFSEPQQATWDSAPLAQELHLSGQAHLNATISLDRPDARFVAQVEEVKSEGSVRVLTIGYLSAAHRHSLTEATPVPLGEPLTYRLRTQPFDVWVSAGSRLRLLLTGIEPKPDPVSPFTTGEGIPYDALPSGTAWTATVAVDGSSVLALPTSNDSCGLLVDQAAPPAAPIPSCPTPPISR